MKRSSGNGGQHGPLADPGGRTEFKRERVSTRAQGSNSRGASGPTLLTLPTAATDSGAVPATLTATNGTYADADTVMGAWFRNGVATGVTTLTYAITTGGNYVWRETATGAEGVTITDTAPLAILGVPENTATPSLSGTAQVGETLTCDPGVWTYSPSFAYAWFRGGVLIAGAVVSTYTLVSADAGELITCRVTATNIAGSDSATTAALGPVTEAPANTVAPSVTGTPTEGETLTCAPGTWTGTPAPTFTYQWRRGGVAISGATSATYAPVVADIGLLIDCRVTGTNVVTSVPAASNSVGPIAAASTWSDPTGLTWDHAWDLGAGDPATNSNIPPLAGGQPLPRVAGSYARGAYPSTYVPAGLDLSTLGPITLAAGSRFTATGLSALTAGAGIHMRFVLRMTGTGSSDDAEFVLEVGDPAGARVQIASDNLYTPFRPQLTARSYTAGGVLRGEETINVPAGEQVVIDVQLSNQGGSEVRRLDLWVDGRQAVSTFGVDAVAALTVGTVDLRDARGDVSFLAVRQTNTLLTSAQHFAGVNALLASVLIARDVDYAWIGDDATPGSAWVDALGALSAAWNASHGGTVSAVAASGASVAAIGARGAIRVVGNSQAPWQTGTTAALAQAAGTSCWIRAVYRHVDPNVNDGAPCLAVNVQESGVGFHTYRGHVYNTNLGYGGGFFQVWPSDTGTNYLNFQRDLPDERGEWNVFDYYLNGATGDTTVQQSGRTPKVQTTPPSPTEIISAYVALLDDSEMDTLLLTLAWGAKADAWSEAMGTHDTNLLRAA